MRAAATRSHKTDADIQDEELDDPKRQDEIRYPKPVKLTLLSGDLEIHTLAARAQRGFAGLALRVSGEAAATMPGVPARVAVSGLLAQKYFPEFLIYIVAALHPAAEPATAKQFEELCKEMDERFASAPAVIDLARIYSHMVETYDLSEVVGQLPKM